MKRYTPSFTENMMEYDSLGGYVLFSDVQAERERVRKLLGGAAYFLERGAQSFDGTAEAVRFSALLGEIDTMLDSLRS